MPIVSEHDDIKTARILLASHFATDGEEDGPEGERIAQAVETLVVSIAEALAVARAQGRQEQRERNRRAVDELRKVVTQLRELEAALQTGPEIPIRRSP
jgi:hypothetical protein